MFSKYSSYINNYQGFKELQYVDLLLLDLQRTTTCKDSICRLQYVDLQLDLQGTTT